MSLSDIAPHLHNLRKGRTKWAMWQFGLIQMDYVAGEDCLRQAAIRSAARQQTRPPEHGGRDHRIRLFDVCGSVWTDTSRERGDPHRTTRRPDTMQWDATCGSLADLARTRIAFD